MSHGSLVAGNEGGLLDTPGETFGQQAFLSCEIIHSHLKDETDDLSRKRRNTVLNTMSHTCQAIAT